MIFLSVNSNMFLDVAARQIACRRIKCLVSRFLDILFVHGNVLYDFAFHWGGREQYSFPRIGHWLVSLFVKTSAAKKLPPPRIRTPYFCANCESSIYCRGCNQANVKVNRARARKAQTRNPIQSCHRRYRPRNRKFKSRETYTRHRNMR